MSELFLFRVGFRVLPMGGSGDVPARSTKRCPNGFPDGFPMGFHGFPGVSSMTLLKTSSTATTFCAEFCSSVSVKTGVSNASEWPYYNIRRPQVIGVGERVGAGPVSSVAPLVSSRILAAVARRVVGWFIRRPN